MSGTQVEEKLVRHMPYKGHVHLSVNLSSEAINGNNYKLLAEKLGCTTEEIRNLETKDDPVMELFRDRRCLDLTIACLKSKLSEMKRLDVIDDLNTYEEETPTPSEYEKMYAERARTGIKEFEDVTVLPGDKKYDAFICHCKRDLLFVQKLLSKLEDKPYQFKFCIDYRDILPGGEKWGTIVNVIEERCRKVIVIISKHFSEDVDADFQAKIALSQSPGCQKKILIPIVYDNKKHVPAILKHITHLDYTNKIAREYFWPNLARSLGYKE